MAKDTILPYLSLYDDSTASFIKNHTGGNPHLLKDARLVEEGTRIEEDSSFKEVTADFLVFADTGKNVVNFFNVIRDPVKRKVISYKGNNLVKFKLNLFFTFERLSGDEEYDEVEVWNNTPFEDLTSVSQFDGAFSRIKERVSAWLDDFEGRGSGLSLIKINYAKLTISKTCPMRGKSYIPYLFGKKYSVLNIQNNDNKCFLYCIIASYFPATRNRTRVSHYSKYENYFSTDYEYPMKICDIPRFENIFRGRYNFAINVFGLENQYDLDTLYPIHLSNNPYPEKVIDLLFLQNEVTSHYCLIDDLGSLVGAGKHKAEICRNCLQSFTTKPALENHQRICGKHDKCVINLPVDTRLHFKNHHFRSRLPVVIYADFETLNKRVDTKLDEGSKYLRKQELISVAVYIKSDYPHLIESGYSSYTGKNCEKVFVDYIDDLYERIIHTAPLPCVMTLNDRVDFSRATSCYICGKDFDQTQKVIEHNHYSGEYRGAACQSCNTKEGKRSKIIPVFFHNGSNYDFHLFITELMKRSTRYKQVSVLPKTTEEYISITYGTRYKKMIFLDSYRFTQKSLADLATSLEDSDYKILRRHFGESFNLLKRKGAYPYEYVTSLGTLDESELPPIGAFYSTLKREGITLEEYRTAQQVWRHFRCKNLRDYHELYLMADVFILADAFEKFRDFFLTHHKIDPCYCYSAPGLTWQCGLKYTDVNLQLLTDYNMLLMIENGIRGGYSGLLGNRHVKANNKYLSDYQPEKASNYLLYLDACNLYGWAMSQPLPVDDFRWEDPNDYRMTEGRGYIFEVDLEYTIEAKRNTYRFPLAPEKKKVNPQEFSDYQRSIMEREDIVSGNIEKLILDLKSKTKYVVHRTLLEFYKKMGMKITKVHRIISYREEAWLAKYINFNTQQRMQSKTAFEKDLWKLMNNAFYGKTLENIRNRKKIDLVSDGGVAKKQFSKPTYDSHVIFNPDLLAVVHNVTSVKFDKPVYLGMVILDYAKLKMYEFYYGVVNRLWPQNEIVASDTDSIFLNIYTGDVYEDMKEIQDTLLDTSNYSATHPLYSPKNAKVPGYFKDELGGKIMKEIIYLRSKAYTYKVEEETVKKLKGICRSTIAKDVAFDDYYSALYNNEVIHKTNYSINSHHHELYLKKERKKAMNAFDDKRFVCADGVTTYPFN